MGNVFEHTEIHKILTLIRTMGAHIGHSYRNNMQQCQCHLSRFACFTLPSNNKRIIQQYIVRLDNQIDIKQPPSPPQKND